MARTQLLPQLGFTEDISRGNDPVYAFGTCLGQRQFTQADFALNALNFPQPIENFSSRFSGQWVAFDSFKTQREIHRADLFKEGASFTGKAVDQQIVIRVVEAYQQVLYAQREIDVAQHEQETATTPLTSVGNEAVYKCGRIGSGTDYSAGSRVRYASLRRGISGTKWHSSPTASNIHRHRLDGRHYFFSGGRPRH